MNITKITEEDFNVKELVKPFLKKWYWFVISLFISLILAVIYIKFTTPVYSMHASVLIKDAKKMSSASGDFGVLAGLGGFAGMGTNSIENELEIFKSKTIMQDMVKDLKMQTSIYSREKFYDVELYKDTNPFIINILEEKQFEALPEEPIDIKIDGNTITLSSEEFKEDIVTSFNKTVSLPFANFMFTKNPKFNPKKVKKLDLKDFYFVYSDLEGAVNNFQLLLNVDLMDKDATVIGLSLQHPNKDKAKDVLNHLVSIYNQYAITDKNFESKKTKDFIDERIVIISEELGDVETEKQRFKVENDIVDIPTETRINLATSNEAHKKSVELDTQIELANMLINYIDSPKNSLQVLPTNIGMDNSSTAVSSNLSLYNTAIIEHQRLLENATPDNPLVIDNARKINAIKLALKESLVKSKTTFEIGKRSIIGEKIDTDIKIAKVPQQEKLFRSIERQQQIKESLYLLLLQKREEAAISMEISGDKARIVDQAYAAKKPVAPKKMFAVLGAMLLGFLIPLAIIYLKEILNSNIISKSDIEKKSSASILAEIPRMSKKDNELIQLNDVSPLAEAFRILVTNIKFMLPKKQGAKVIFITSTVKGEGKTFVSVNLSLALATPAIKVLVIGSDIRNPQLQRYNPSMKKANGLTEFLYENVDDVKEIIHPSGFNANCDFIYSGSIPPNPADLLQNGRYQILLDRLKDDYDYIILDTAPLMLVTDSFLISSVADVTIYVTRSEVSDKNFIDFANKNIESSKIKNVGFVLNDLHKSNLGYGNKYGYGYQADEKKWWNKIFKM